ncbi:cell division protein CrgA [Brachybacterium nesterenkovii]|uniref:Cell division protein CrgA n=1 Tax=Brachybacterium nesterenkovii TaxID=47847 RepID=A0A1X6X6I5_9MICO|nr:cell division protein CrgA [Brachybacterium nesterenkovii]SLM94805.1 putative septation inhibitor protein [Brachybacterium nesterenkovii]
MARSKRRRTQTDRPSTRRAADDAPEESPDLEDLGDAETPDGDADALSAEADALSAEAGTEDGTDAPTSEDRAGRESPEVDGDADGDADEAFDGFDDEIRPTPRKKRRPAEPTRRSRKDRAGSARPGAKRRDDRAEDDEDTDDTSPRDSRRGRKATVLDVPEKAKDSSATETARARRAAEAERTRAGRRRAPAATVNPAWLAPTAVALLILGLVYLVVYYLSTGQLPLPIGNWNLAAGFGIMMAGGAMLMFWK